MPITHALHRQHPLPNPALQYGNGTLRLTTRQAFQLHGVLKQNLKTVFSTVVKNLGSTLGACGDVNRNVMSPPAPYTNRPEYAYAEQVANDIADLLAPQSGAYYDVWLDGEKFYAHAMEVRVNVHTLVAMDTGCNTKHAITHTHGEMSIYHKHARAHTAEPQGHS